MSCRDEHDQGAAGSRALTIALLINVAVTAVEGVAGVLTGSLALLADALHNLSDVASLALEESFSIAHATFQFETVPCRETGVLADPRTVGGPHP